MSKRNYKLRIKMKIIRRLTVLILALTMLMTGSAFSVLAENAGDYGWSLSFPDGYEDVTGYRWECWHFRYLGIPAVEFQRKWFSDVQQFMLEFIHAWKTVQ